MPNCCPNCGACRTCGAPEPRPYPLIPNPWPWQPTTAPSIPWNPQPVGPIWVAPMTPEHGAPYYTVTCSAGAQ